MTQSINLKEIERKAFTSYFQDGLWEIALAFLLLQMGSGRLLTYFGLPDIWGLAVYLPGLLFLIAGKKFITIPRLGQVKFGPKRKRNRRKTILVLSVSVLLGIGLFAVSGIIGEWQIGQLIIPVIFSLNAIIVFSLMAYFMDFSRLYAYGVLIGLSLFLAEFLDRYTGFYFALSIPFGISAGIMFFIGLVLFIRFLRDNPLPTEDIL